RAHCLVHVRSEQRTERDCCPGGDGPARDREGASVVGENVAIHHALSDHAWARRRDDGAPDARDRRHGRAQGGGAECAREAPAHAARAGPHALLKPEIADRGAGVLVASAARAAATTAGAFAGAAAAARAYRRGITAVAGMDAAPGPTMLQHDASRAAR